MTHQSKTPSPSSALERPAGPSLKRFLPVALIPAVVLVLAGCGGGASADPEVQPSAFPTPVVTASVAVVLLDSSASVLKDTDLVAAAQNRITDLVAQSPVGGTVVVKALNDVSANCEDLRLTLPAQANDTMLEQAREANRQSVAVAFPDYIDCVTATDPGGTQLLGLLATALTDYPHAQIIDAYTDGIDTFDLRGVRKESNLRDPAFIEHALDNLPPALIPPMQPTTTITWHALGRGTGFDAVAISGLKQIYTNWTTATGATPTIAPN